MFLERLVDQETMLAVEAERAVLAEVQGGCRLPLGAWARFADGRCWSMLACCPPTARNHSPQPSGECASTGDAVKLGKRVAGELLEAGADRLLRLAGRVA